MISLTYGLEFKCPFCGLVFKTSRQKTICPACHSKIAVEISID